MKPANPTATPDQAAWAPLLEQAVQEVFKIMLGCELQPPDGTSEDPQPGDFTSMVGLAGDLCGVLTLRCSTGSAMLMTSKMLGTDTGTLDEQVWDALGEVCNMVAGNFKNKLPGLGDRCMLSVPTVITGGDYNCHALADAGRIEVMSLFEGSPIIVSLEIHT